MKQILFTILLLLTFAYSSSAQMQHNEKITIQDNISRFNVSIQGVYYSFEKRIAPVFSLYGDLGMGAVFGWNSSYGYRWAISPTIAIEGRWYYNYLKRYEKGKKVLFNAANFLSLQTAYVFKPIDYHLSYINSGAYMAANWGMQRTWTKHINFEFKLGFGLVYYDEVKEFGAGANINLKLGYIFNKVK